MNSNSTIIRKAAISTGSLTSGLLNPEQARKFIQQTFDATNLGGLIRHEQRTAKTGEIDKIGNTSRHMTFEARKAVLSVKRQRTQTTAIVQA